MGNAGSSGQHLTQLDIEELIAYSKDSFTQPEVEALYKRFRALDRGRKGFITSEEFLTIPELSINPLAKRLAYMFESINFKEFVLMLAPYSSRANRDDKLRHMFAIWDVDGDGVVSEGDMELILRQRAGTTLLDDQVAAIIHRTMSAAGVDPKKGMTLSDYRAALADVDINLQVDIPSLD